MKANRSRDAASPRFARGLAILALMAALVLLAYCGLPRRGDNNAPPLAAEVTVAKTHSLAARQGRFATKMSQDSASRGHGWANALAVIQIETDPNTREEQWANLLAGISRADTSAILKELQDAGLGGHEFTQRLLRRWAQTDGRAAATWTETLPAGAARDSALSGVATEWANTDLQSAVEWAQQLSVPSDQTTTLLAIANEAVRAEPMEALRLAVELPANSERDDAIRRAATEWASQDGRSAVDWARGISDPSLRNAIWAAEVVAWSDIAPEAAARFAVESLPTGRLLEDTVVSIVQRWWQQQPDVATAWVEQFPPGELKVAALENITALQAIQDQPSAEPTN